MLGKPHVLGDISVTMDAPADCVWAILTDFDRYSDWNPFTPRVVGHVATDSTFVLQVKMPRDMEVTRRVYTFDYERRIIQWGIATPRWWLHTEQTQVVHVSTPEGSVYHSREVISGLLAPLVLLTSRKQVQAGFEAVAAPLKREAEQHPGQ